MSLYRYYRKLIVLLCLVSGIGVTESFANESDKNNPTDCYKNVKASVNLPVFPKHFVVCNDLQDPGTQNIPKLSKSKFRDFFLTPVDGETMWVELSINAGLAKFKTAKNSKRRPIRNVKRLVAMSGAEVVVTK